MQSIKHHYFNNKAPIKTILLTQATLRPYIESIFVPYGSGPTVL